MTTIEIKGVCIMRVIKIIVITVKDNNCLWLRLSESTATYVFPFSRNIVGIRYKNFHFLKNYLPREYYCKKYRLHKLLHILCEHLAHRPYPFLHIQYYPPMYLRFSTGWFLEVPHPPSNMLDNKVIVISFFFMPYSFLTIMRFDSLQFSFCACFLQ